VLATGLPTIYHVDNSRENYALIAPVISAAWQRFKQAQV